MKGYVEPVNVAGVKVIGDFHGNYKYGLPSELALVTLYRPETGAPEGEPLKYGLERDFFFQLS